MAELGSLKGSRQWSGAEPLKTRKHHESMHVSYTISRDCTNAGHTSRKRLYALSSKLISNKRLTRALEPTSTIDETRMNQMNAALMKPQMTNAMRDQPGMQQQLGMYNAQIHSQIMHNLQSQGPFSGWQAAVPIPERATRIRQLFDSVRLIRPLVEPPQAAEVAILLERKAFAQIASKEDYIRECNEKLAHIRDQRAQQMNVNGATIEQQTDDVLVKDFDGFRMDSSKPESMTPRKWFAKLQRTNMVQSQARPERARKRDSFTSRAAGSRGFNDLGPYQNQHYKALLSALRAPTVSIWVQEGKDIDRNGFALTLNERKSQSKGLVIKTISS